MDNPPSPNQTPGEDAGKKANADRADSSSAQQPYVIRADKLSVDETINVTRLPKTEQSVSIERIAKENESNQPIIGLSINVPGRSAPIRVKSTEKITIGRQDRASSIAPTVDLSGDHAAMLGVSRQHVEIRMHNNICFVRDLESANGSWLNETPLPPHIDRPLHNGDQLRLGHLICFVYMIYANSTSELAELDEHVTTIHLADSNLKTKQLRTGLSPHYLISTLGNYLDAVISLQMLQNHITEAIQPDAAIQSFQVDHGKKQMHVEMKNVRDIIHFLNQKNYLWQTTAFDDSQTDVVSRQLAMALWQTMGKKSEQEQDSYIKQMTAYFKTIITSNLKLVDDSESQPPTSKTVRF